MYRELLKMKSKDNNVYTENYWVCYQEMHNTVTTNISHWKHTGTKDVQSHYITITKLWILNLTRSNQQCLYFPLRRRLLIEPLGRPQQCLSAAWEDVDKEDTACEDPADEDVGCGDPADEGVGCEDPADEDVGCGIQLMRA